jgi:hypothetical protein
MEGNEHKQLNLKQSDGHEQTFASRALTPMHVVVKIHALVNKTKSSN